MDVNRNSYVTIQAFMVNDLHLGGNELILYAVIYGFSQDGQSWFSGSRAYLGQWCQASKVTVTANMKKLVEKGLVERRERVENGVTFVDYRAVAPESTEMQQLNRVDKNLNRGVDKNLNGGSKDSLPGGSKDSLPHTLEDDITRETIDRDKGAKAPSHRLKASKPENLQEVRDYIREMGYGLDPEEFWDANEQAGWKLKNGKPVQDWKARVRTFERNRKKWGHEATGKTPIVTREPSTQPKWGGLISV